MPWCQIRTQLFVRGQTTCTRPAVVVVTDFICQNMMATLSFFVQRQHTAQQRANISLSLSVRGEKHTHQAASGERRQRKGGRAGVWEGGRNHGGMKGEMSGKTEMENARSNGASQER